MSARLSAAIFPAGQLSDETVDTVVTRALQSGLVPCNAKQGPFRIAFFPPAAIPATWSRIGITTVQEPAPCHH